MDEYINRKELERRIKKYVKPETPEEKALIEWCKDECIRQAYAMPRADAVEVVRCKDCKNWDNNYKCCLMMGLTSAGDSYFYENSFCSYGEMKAVENAERCVVCGEVIPDGRQVCPPCEKQSTEHKYFSPDDVRRMTAKEVKENYSAIIASMEYWGQGETI